MLVIFPISAKEFAVVHSRFSEYKETDYYERNANSSHYKEWTTLDPYFAAFCQNHYKTQPLRAGYNIGNGNAEVGSFKMGEVKIECHFAFYMTSGSNISGVLKVTPEMRKMGYPLAVGFYAIYKGARSCSNRLEGMLPRLKTSSPTVYVTTGETDMFWWETQKEYFMRNMEKALAYFKKMISEYPDHSFEDLGMNEQDVIIYANREGLDGWDYILKHYRFGA